MTNLSSLLWIPPTNIQKSKFFTGKAASGHRQNPSTHRTNRQRTSASVPLYRLHSQRHPWNVKYNARLWGNCVHHGFVCQLWKRRHFHASRRQHSSGSHLSSSVSKITVVHQTPIVCFPHWLIRRIKLHTVLSFSTSWRSHLVLSIGDGIATFRHDSLEFGAVLAILLRHLELYAAIGLDFVFARWVHKKKFWGPLSH